mgnify:FL=1
MKKKKNGFTLIELLVVISIFGILMGLVVSQLGGVLGTSEKTKMQSIMRTWVIKLKQYKTHYGYYPPFLYESGEGVATMLNDPQDNQNRFLFSLKGKEKSDTGWSDGNSFEDENRDFKEFHSFSDDEFDEEGNLIAYESIRILLDHDRDGAIVMDNSLVDEIFSSLSLEYDKSEMENLDSLRDNFSLINEDIAIFILTDETTNLSNLFSWNIEKYLSSD